VTISTKAISSAWTQRRQQRRGIQAGDARDHPAQRLEQRLGGAHGELAERVVEVGLDQLQHEAQQDDRQVQADQGLHHENRGAGQCIH
jgi:hypothetical protein